MEKHPHTGAGNGTAAIPGFITASGQELARVFADAPIGFVVLRGPELIYEYVNAAYQAFSPGIQLIGQPFATASWELPEVMERLQAVFATGQPWHGSDIPLRIERSPGQPLEQGYFTFSCFKVRGRGRPSVLVGFVVETTDRVRACQDVVTALQESRLRSAELESIIETMVEGVGVFDADRHITLINRAARTQMMNAGVDPALFERADDLVQRLRVRSADGHPVTTDRLPLTRALAGEACRETLQFWNDQQKRVGYASIGAAPIRRDGRIVAAVVVGSDITEMTELDRLKDEFIRVTAHELKTPITILKGYASALTGSLGPSVTPEQRRMLEAIDRGAERINRIMCELLDAQQIELGHFELITAPVDLDGLVAESVARVAARSPASRVRVTDSAPARVHADDERLREVMRILLDNAVRYSPDGGDIEVALTVKPGTAVVSVCDHGVGIAPERRERLFQRFYRAHTGTPYDYGGTGLGLFVARAIIERHGGTLRYANNESGGSTFVFELPLEPAP